MIGRTNGHLAREWGFRDACPATNATWCQHVVAATICAVILRYCEVASGANARSGVRGGNLDYAASPHAWTSSCIRAALRKFLARYRHDLLCSNCRLW